MLNDREIYDAIGSGELRLENAAITDGDFGKDAPVQPASLDLHVGEIFLPLVRRPKGLRSVLAFFGSQAAPRGRLEYDLKQGETAFIRTREKIYLGSSLSAFGFPPTEVSTAGVLMTNPGHVDPGYQGHLHFTVVNMGKEPFVLKSDNRIVTLLLVRLSHPPTADFAARRGGLINPLDPTSALLSLSQDFLDIEGRASQIAHRRIREAELRSKYGTPILVALITALSAIGGGFVLGLFDLASKEDITRLEDRLLGLEMAVDRQAFDERLDRIENLVDSGNERRNESEVPSGD